MDLATESGSDINLSRALGRLESVTQSHMLPTKLKIMRNLSTPDVWMHGTTSASQFHPMSLHWTRKLYISYTFKAFLQCELAGAERG